MRHGLSQSPLLQKQLSKQTRKSQAGIVVECLPSKHKALSSNHSAPPTPPTQKE
jgi:hypothetical protein